jgi:hypothetical protein
MVEPSRRRPSFDRPDGDDDRVVRIDLVQFVIAKLVQRKTMKERGCSEHVTVDLHTD